GGAQMEQDLAAHDLINARHRQAIGEIDQQEAQRGDPMTKQLEAAAKSRAYERLQGLGEKSHVYASEGDVSGGYLGDKGYGIPTLGEAQDSASAQALARAKQSPTELTRADLASQLA